MKEFAIVIILMISGACKAQQYVILANENDGQPIAYANVWLSNKLYTTSNERGVVAIKDNDVGNTFDITALGFEAMKNIKLTIGDSIYFKSSYIELKEIKVDTKKKYETIKLGKAKSADVGIAARMEDHTSQIARYFPNTGNSNSKIKQVRFTTKCTTHDRTIAISLYTLGKDGQPGHMLIAEPIMCDLAKGRNLNTIDLLKYNIYLPEEGIFVIANYILTEKNRQYGLVNKDWYFYEPILDGEKLENPNGPNDTWIFRENEWTQSPNLSVSFQLHLLK